MSDLVIDLDVLLPILCGVFGAMLGSFLNVVIYRMPERKSIVWPGSHCPGCGGPIRWFDNIPILSFLVLRARCRSCSAPISWQYPLVEALTAGLVAAAAVRHLTGGVRDWPVFLVTVLLLAAFVAVAFIDLKHQIIPDRITKTGMVAAPILSLMVPGLHRSSPLFGSLGQLPPSVASLLICLTGMVAGAGSIWLMGALGKAIFRKESMGFGDVKFMGLVGGFVGPVGVLLVGLLACVVGSVVGVTGWLITRSHYIPFGPFLSLGAVAVIFFRPEIVHFLTVTYPSLFHG